MCSPPPSNLVYLLCLCFLGYPFLGPVPRYCLFSIFVRILFYSCLRVCCRQRTDPGSHDLDNMLQRPSFGEFHVRRTSRLSMSGICLGRFGNKVI